MFKSTALLLVLSSVLCTFAQFVPSAGQPDPKFSREEIIAYIPHLLAQLQPAHGSVATYAPVTEGNLVSSNSLQNSVANQVALANGGVVDPVHPAYPAYNFQQENEYAQEAPALEYRYGDRIVPPFVPGPEIDPGFDGQWNRNPSAPQGPATYRYGYEINDNINGQYQQKSEARNGDLVSGSYEYDDGQVTRYVKYVADKKGFRIVEEKTGKSKMASTPRTGKATVKSVLNDAIVNYDINSSDPNKYGMNKVAPNRFIPYPGLA